MRRFIATMQMSVDAKIEGPDGYADWVDAWSDDAGVIPEVDGALLGGGMYPGYEQYWSGVYRAPTEPSAITGKTPTAGEVEYARFAMGKPHYVLSKTLPTVGWKHTRLLRDIGEVRTLKQQPGKAIYVVGGARTVASFIDLGLIDELRFTLHPLVAGPGKALFETLGRRHRLTLRRSAALSDGRVSLTYDVHSG